MRVVRFGRFTAYHGVELKSILNQLPVSRVAVVVGAQVDKRASARNRLKRRLREIMRHELPRIRQGYDVVVWGRKELLTKNFSQLQQEVYAVLRRARLV